MDAQFSPAEPFALAPTYPVANISNPANHGFEAVVRTIFKRCVECPAMDPTCPPCKSNEACVQVFGGCNTCSENKCVPQSQSGGTVNSQSSSSGGPNIGAIVGGVLGGVAVIALVSFLVWRFCFRGKKDDEYLREQEEKDTSYSQTTDPSSFSEQAARRQSTRSVASTVMTRASNVIQIAFIPGITGRAEDVPPVPQLPQQQYDGSSYPSSPVSQPYDKSAGTPIAMTPYRDRSPAPGTPQSAHSHHGEEEDQFFMPQDLRMQRYSQFSDETDTLADGRSMRYRSIASLSPSLVRESVVSTMPHEPVPPMPATMIRGGRANVVSVKGSSAQNTPGQMTDVPAADYFKYNNTDKKSTPPSSSASSARNAPRHETEDTATEMSGPRNPRTNQVQAAIEEATRRASARPTHGGLGSLNTRNREGSPRGLRPPRTGSPMSARARDVSPLASSARDPSSREGSVRDISSRSDPSSRSQATREQSPTTTRPGTANSREAGPFSDKHAATPP